MRRGARSVASAALACGLLAIAAPAAAAHATVAHFGNALDAVACPSAAECVAVDDTDAYRFDPAAAGHPTGHRVDRQDIVGIACPATTQCTVVDDAGDEVTFDPGTRRVRRRVRLTHGTFEYAVACPSTTQCTAIDGVGDETTFDPMTQTPPTPPRAVPIGSNPDLTGIDCPTTSQCTVVDGAGEATTFDPASPGAATTVGLTGGAALTAVACPAATQCTATGLRGVVTFDPQAASPPALGPAPLPRAEELEAISCPSTSQCTMTAGQAGNRPSFAELGVDPAPLGAPLFTPLADRLPGASTIALACPAATQCTAAFDGEEVTFDPADPGTIVPTVAVVGARRARVELACTGASACVGRLTLRARGVHVSVHYRIPRGARRAVALGVHRRRRATLTITVTGGRTVRRTLVLE